MVLTAAWANASIWVIDYKVKIWYLEGINDKIAQCLKGQQHGFMTQATSVTDNTILFLSATY
jgi:hypothetical protein